MYKLPKKVNRKEAKVDGPVLEWLLKHWPRSFALEVKVAGGKLKDHQEKALKQVESGKFGYKIPDMGRRNPFDCFGLINADAMVCTVDGKNVSCVVNSSHEVKFRI